jgi:hypothetical protein
MAKFDDIRMQAFARIRPALDGIAAFRAGLDAVGVAS